MNRRSTATQTAILQLLQRERTALSHDMIQQQLTVAADRVTVYRILNRFVEDGLAHRIVADNGKQYFAACAHDCTHDAGSHDHLHFRCSDCERVECLTDHPVRSLPEGYRAEHYNAIVSGQCAACSGRMSH